MTTDYGKGAVLPAALLPATSAGILFADRVHPLILTGLLAISMISLITLIAYATRYLKNRNG